MRQRGGVQDRFIVPEIGTDIRVEPIRHAPQVTVGQHRAFRHTRRPRSVEQPGDVIGRRIDVDELDGFGSQQHIVILSIGRRGPGRDDVLQIWKVTSNPGDLLVEARSREQCRCLRIGNNVSKLAGMEPPIDGDSCTADLESGEHHFQHLRAIDHQDRHMIARLNAESSQGVGQPIDTRIELFIVHLARTADRRDITRMRCGGPSEQRSDVHDSSSRNPIDGNATIMSDRPPL